MEAGRASKALPPLLHRYADAVDRLRESDPRAFEHLAPLHRELELVHALVQQSLRDHPGSVLSRRFDELNQIHQQLPEIAGARDDARATGAVVGPWNPPVGVSDPRLDHLSVIVGKWPLDSDGKTCSCCGKAI